MKRRVALGVFAAGPLAAAKPPVLLVAAASDLAPIEQPLSELLHKTAGVRMRFVLGSSGMLAAQIAGGAPYHVFLSASPAFLDNLERSGKLAAGTRRTFAQGQLALWSSRSVASLEDLLKPEIRYIAIANPAHAPYGAAARQALERKKLWRGLEGKILLAESVRHALQLAERGNADAAIVAWSLLVGRTQAAPLPTELHDPLLQGGAVIAGSALQKEGVALITLLMSEPGQGLLARFGFLPPPSRA